MGKIVVLDELTINQIAAGEVIERPASVVKELVENSIDAGAKNITVEVKNGGISRIRIADDGSGIAKDDLEFAFERHATSKIKAAKDLESVKSMGFRGEALASIAAISHIEMITKTKDEDIGKKIIVEGGKTLEIEDTGAQKGTIITISNLFYNTPVRYKFLKKDYTELGYIEDAITRIALANPDIAIRLTNESKTIIQTPGNGDIQTVIYNIYGNDVVNGLLKVDYQYEDIKVEGVVGKPEIARSNKSYQMFFVNKRYIKDKTLTAGVEQAFKGLLPIGKFGFLVLNLNMEPQKIDVNVHPTKLEIRFQEEQKVFKAVYHAIRESLLRDELVANVEQNENNENVEDIEAENVQDETKGEKKGLFNLFKKKEEEDFIEKHADNTLADIFTNRSKPIEETPVETEPIVENDSVESNETKNIEEQETEFTKLSPEFDKMYDKTFGTALHDENKVEEIKDYNLKPAENISVFEEKEKYNKVPDYKYCGTIFSTYIIIEIKDDVYILDQHAAHERVMYEKIRKNFYKDAQKDSQVMLLPDIINLSHKEKAIAQENIEIFQKAGFTLEEFGENTIRLIGVPAICMEMDTKELFLEILDELDKVAITATQEKEDRFIATIACKSAVKAKMNLNSEEVKQLLEQLLILPNPFTCPHGRPTAIKMSKKEIEKKFSRT